MLNNLDQLHVVPQKDNSEFILICWKIFWQIHINWNSRGWWLGVLEVFCKLYLDFRWGSLKIKKWGRVPCRQIMRVKTAYLAVGCPRDQRLLISEKIEGWNAVGGCPRAPHDHGHNQGASGGHFWASDCESSWRITAILKCFRKGHFKTDIT